MHSVQIQNAAIVEALQAVRGFSSPFRCIVEPICSFELGGEKKTKGAALTFVRHLSHTVPLGITNRTEFLVTYLTLRCCHLFSPITILRI